MGGKSRDSGRRSKASRWEKGYRTVGQRPPEPPRTGGRHERGPKRPDEASVGRLARRAERTDEGNENALAVGGVHHVAIKTRDVDRLAAFYRDVLGLSESTRHEDGHGLRSVWLDCGTALLMLERSDYDDDQPRQRRDFQFDPPGLHLLALRIDAGDRDAWRVHLAEHDTEVVRETAYTLYIRDPDGNRIGISSWPDG